MPILRKIATFSVHFKDGRNDLDPQREHRNMIRTVIARIYPVNNFPQLSKPLPEFHITTGTSRSTDKHSTEATSSLLLEPEV